MAELKNVFFYAETEGDLLTNLRSPDDPYAMNWIEGRIPWGTVKVPAGISASVVRAFTSAGALKETYTFTNTSAYPVFTCLGDIGVYTPFNDSYHEAAVCMKSRCHAHIWCGGTSSYVMCLRMGGEAPHLGMVLTGGQLGAYSVERDLSRGSNDRGDFILHPAPLRLEPGENAVVEWELFWHRGKEDFYRRLRDYPSYVEITAVRFVCFEGETSGLQVQRREGQPETELAVEETGYPGEIKYLITGNGVDTWCRVLNRPPPVDLAAARCAFIAKNQQYHKLGSPLDGAYLIYDNEEGHPYYTHTGDHNGSRERIGMGLLMARFLRSRSHAVLENSLKQYVAFVLRELFDSGTGTVFDDINHAVDRVRLYNFPWFAQFFLEIYGLWKDPAYLRYMYKALDAFYEKGGGGFYAIGIPMVEALAQLGAEGFRVEADKLREQFLKHAGTVLQNGAGYPAHEVNYEQSIVAPAAHILFQAYRISNDEKYLEGAKKQLEILSLFNGKQPDSCLYEVSIRHWDGFWFGKRRLYGDTFPHYWSVLTGMVYAEFWRTSGGEEARAAAEHSIRAVLGLIRPDGSASCARLYPLSVNGVPANFLDPWANDQDWGLYYALKFFDGDF
ncbi:MAG: hypothetical protein LBP20_06380 [Treponema sp.]|jgi:hypothetical protein|nr:hypothetical protein [Treponema sp.]